MFSPAQLGGVCIAREAPSPFFALTASFAKCSPRFVLAQDHATQDSLTG
jgi:hypothetical protein